MPLTPRQQEDVLSHLRNVAELEGLDLSVETLVGLLFQEWDTIINPRTVRHVHANRRLRSLKEHRQSVADNAAALDKEIADLEDEVQQPVQSRGR